MGSSGGVGGALGFEGAFLLQCPHWSLVWCTSLVIPGQNTEASALEIMDVLPWWAAWSTASTSALNDGGMTILSLYRMTPSTVVRQSLNLKYSLSSGCISLAESGKFVSIVSTKSWSSLAVARRTLSRVTDWSAESWPAPDEIGAMSSGSVNCSGLLVGFLERVSAAMFFTPCMWTMVKAKPKVFSFKLRSLGFWISWRWRSPKILSRGL